MDRQRINLPIKWIIVIAVTFLLVIFIIRYLWQTLKTLDYFKIKDVKTNENTDVELSYLKGQNIFTVDLQRESRYLSQIYPVYKMVRLIRILPNQIFIDFIRRKPIGLIKLYRYFSVDEDLVLMDMPSQIEGQDLPVIAGLETKIFGPRLGNKYNIKELLLALDIINELRLDSRLKDYKIKKIDVTNTASATLFLSPPADFSKVETAPTILEIKIGQEDTRGKINILSNLLTQIKRDTSNIKYIDLRFKEPVIKLKDAR